MFDNIEDFKKDFNWVGQLNRANYEQAALTLFRFQAKKNPVYKAYIESIGIDQNTVQYADEIPFLPISFFKSHQVICSDFQANDFFESSGTTATVNSRHYFPDTKLYQTCFLHHFQAFYGAPSQYVFFCLLPSYLEREHASLVCMAETLIKKSNHRESAFYLHDFQKLSEELAKAIKTKKKIILLGVTFALLDFAEAYPMDISSVIVMETGGMKGRREEWTRPQVHEFLKEKWNLPAVHSEYGMTELFSQAYSDGEGLFWPANLMRLSVRDRDDPFSNFRTGNGCINVMDLGNLYSCGFIATDDLGEVNADGSFRILGRIDYAALRGCSLLSV